MQTPLHLKYGLNESILSDFYELLIDFIHKKGGIIKFANLEKVIETEIYEVNLELLNGTEHHETAVSNGLEIFLHDDLNEVGFEARVYDLLHVGLGHFWQWNADPDSDLEFYGDYAWEFANKFYLGKPDNEIETVRRYEEEAGRIAIYLARDILRNAKQISPSQRKAIITFYDHYLQTDLDYITYYYRFNELPEFHSVWREPATMLRHIYTKFPIKPVKREGICIPLISNHRNIDKLI